MEGLSTVPEVQDVRQHGTGTRNFWPKTYGLKYILYALSLVASISIWLLAIHAPLRQDETGSWWLISAGLSKIWFRQYLGFPSYSYILWLSTKIIGTSEVALRIPSILAMLGAVWLLYLAARELFSRELAVLAAIIFCLHPIVVFESIDIRPYAFAVLATNAAILVLLRMRRSDSMWLAALFGFLAALMASFHYLFALVLPAFVVCFFLIKTGHRRMAMWRQFGVAAAVFVLVFLPMIPGIEHLFRTSGAHVYEAPPQWGDLLVTIAPGLLAFVFCGVVLLAALLSSFESTPKESPRHQEIWRILVCASLALIPLLILYGVSVATPIHMFAARHRLVAIPGLALCWAWLIERCLKTQPLRLMFCIVLVAGTAFHLFRSPEAGRHGSTWKYAFAVVEKNASTDNAPVLLCSGFIESHYAPMPLHSAKTSRYFASLSYYKLSVPVVPLPFGINDQTRQIGSQFLKQAAQKHQRFLAVESAPSHETLDWLSQQASPNYNVRRLGTFDTIKILEFDPRAPAIPPLARSSGQPSRLSARAASRPATP